MLHPLRCHLAQRLTASALGSALACGALLCACAPLVAQETPIASPPLPSIEWRKNLVYAQRGTLELALDFARPSGDARDLPCVIAIHGGGWRSGSRGDLHALVEELVAQGFAAATLSYRLLPEHRFPAAWEDVRDAHAFLVAQASELAIDPERFAAVGFSAGGHLALLLGTSDEARDPGRPRVRAVGNFFGPTDLGAADLPERAQGIVSAFLGADPASADALRRSSSPLFHVSSGDARVRSFHGTADPLVPFSQAVALHAALLGAGVSERLDPREGAEHGWQRADMVTDARTLCREWKSWLCGGGKLPLLLREDFEATLDPWWRSDPSAWQLAGESGARAAEIATKASKYAPRHRSPLHLAVREELVVASFVLDLDLRTTQASYGHRDLVLVLGWQDPEHFYYVHLGQSADDASHGVFLVNGTARRRLPGERQDGTPWGERWHRVRLARDVEAGSIELYFDDFDQPHLRAEDSTFVRGAIGFGSFDDTGRFDALRLYALPQQQRDTAPSAKR